MRDKRFDQAGMTLIEVLASIVILAIVILCFTAFFIQSAKSSKLAERKLEATYVAQAEMEKIYGLSAQDEPVPAETGMTGELGYRLEDGLYIKVDHGYQIEVDIGGSGDSREVYIKVKEPDSLVLKASMETRMDWEESSP